MKLYEINGIITEVLLNSFSVDEDTGEILFDVDDLDALEMERNEKAEELCLYVKELRAQAAAIKAEKDSLAARQKAKESKADSIERYIKDILDGDKIDTPRVSVTYRKSKKVVVDDPDHIPELFLRIKTEADKTRIKKALAGPDADQLDGIAHLEETVSMTIK